MNKAQANDLINESSTKERFLASRENQEPKNWLFFAGTYQAAGEPDPESLENWFGLAVLNSSLNQQSGNLLQSDGGAFRIFSDSISSVGNAHQLTDGTWLWDTD